MRKITLLLCLSALVALEASAAKAIKGWHDMTQPDGSSITVQLCGDEWFHYYMTPDGQTLALDADGWLRPFAMSRDAAKKAPRFKLQKPNKTWDASRVYKIPVVLVSFQDRDFSTDDPAAFYNDMFNTPGFNLRQGPGCVADYFRVQSGGLFKPQFDIYGPVKSSTSMRKNGDYGGGTLRDALRTVVDRFHELDFSVYDWDGNGEIEQVLFIYAGYGGNEAADTCKNCIWPNTSSFSSVTIGNVKASYYSASPELFSVGILCGLGTACHEFSHNLGLPDLYPVPANESDFSVVDEWDLMDGGNFTNAGWCPPNYSALEREILGWREPIELTETTQIRDMLPVSQGGDAYRVTNDASDDNVQEFYLLENRQWEDWDKFLPGHGLYITHVDYDAKIWTNNRVNTSMTHHRYEAIHADGLNYSAWKKIIGSDNPYSDGHSNFLKGTPFPYYTFDDDVNCLTDTSSPAATVFNKNVNGDKLMSKPIYNITEEDGLVSFDFYASNGEVVNVIQSLQPVTSTGKYYTLSGQHVAAPLRGRLYISDGKKVIFK